MNTIFWNIKKAKKNMYLIFCKFKKAKKAWIWFFYNAQKISKKHEFSFLQP